MLGHRFRLDVQVHKPVAGFTRKVQLFHDVNGFLMYLCSFEGMKLQIPFLM